MRSTRAKLKALPRPNKSMKKEMFVFDGIALSPNSADDDAIATLKKKLNSIGISLGGRKLDVCKKSVDARKKEDIKKPFVVMLFAW